MGRYKLTKKAWSLIAIAGIAGIIAGGIKFGVLDKTKDDLSKIKNNAVKVSQLFDKNDSDEEKYAKVEEIVKEKDTINISLDEWIG